MARPLQVSASRAYPAGVEHAFDTILPAPLERIFRRRFGAIAPIRAVRDQDGVWGTPGQTRTISLADGGTMREELTAVDRPHRFGYTISHVTGPMKPLASAVEGRWTFEPAGTGTRVTWSWTVHPRNAVSALAMPIFARMWQGYARKALEEIEPLLLAVE
jgi:hypothetical protein